MSRPKAKRQPKKAAIADAAVLRKAHKDLLAGICIVECAARSLECKGTDSTPEETALDQALKLVWPAQEWLHERVMDLPPDDDEEENAS